MATNFGGGYTSAVFDNNLGYTTNFVLDGTFIYIGKVRVIIIILYVNMHVYHCVRTMFLVKQN